MTLQDCKDLIIPFLILAGLLFVTYRQGRLVERHRRWKREEPKRPSIISRI